MIHAAEDGAAYDAALALRAAGKFTEAEKAAQTLVEARTQALGAEDKKTLRARLVDSLDAQDKLEECEKECLPLLAAQTRVLGPEAVKTQRTRYKLAMSLLMQGRGADAGKEFRRLLAVQQRALGEGSRQTITCQGASLKKPG